MKTRDGILQTLSGLGASDRQWIVERLSPITRAALLGTNLAASASERPVNNLSHAPSFDASAQPLPGERLRRATARSIVALVADEPSWVLHALLQDSNWPWRDEVLQLCGATLRNEIARLDAAGVRYAKQLMDTLLAEVEPLLADTVAPMVAKPSPFEILVTKIGSRFQGRRQRLRA